MSKLLVAAVIFNACAMCSASISNENLRALIDSKNTSQQNTSEQNTEPFERLHFEVFYETKCPYSQQIIQDIDRLMNSMGEYLNFSLYPFGNAQAIKMDKVSDGYKYWHPEVNNSNYSHVFMCQHGEMECLGNMIHACALDILNSSAESISFFACMARNSAVSIEKASLDCAQELSIDLVPIRDCAYSADGNHKMAKIADKTESAWIQYTPWVSMNTAHAVSAENGYIQRIVCTALLGQNIIPDACQEIELLQLGSESASHGVEHEHVTRKGAPEPSIQVDAEIKAAEHNATVTASPPLLNVDPLHLKVYYETRCPYSLMLIRDLDSVWSTDFHHYIKLEMVPFGNAQAIAVDMISEGYKFWHSDMLKDGYSHIFLCQHGEDECMGNLMHQCFMEHTKFDATKYIPLFACMAEHPSWSIEKASWSCVQEGKLGDDVPHSTDADVEKVFKDVKECVQSVKSNHKMAEIGNKTNSLVPPRSYVPWVTLNGIHVSSTENGYLQRLMCTVLLGSGEFPAACHGIEMLQMNALTDEHGPEVGTGQNQKQGRGRSEYVPPKGDSQDEMTVKAEVLLETSNRRKSESPVEDAMKRAQVAADAAAAAAALAEKAMAAAKAYGVQPSEANSSGIVSIEPEKAATLSLNEVTEQDLPAVQLEIVYESQCPYSLMLLQDLAKVLPQIYPAEKMKSKLNLRMLPFGNAQAIPTSQVSAAYKFWHPNVEKDGHIFLCQHGEGECLGNMIHLCAMDQIKDPAKYVPFLGCMAANPNYSVEKSSYECAAQHNVSAKELKECVKSVPANAKMAKIGNETMEIKGRTWVPWVMVNGVHAPSAENGYLERLLCTVELGGAADGPGSFPEICKGLELLQTSSHVVTEAQPQQLASQSMVSRHEVLSKDKIPVL
eukprot:gnl/TRDRNA2_/TRDRNA2_84673_c0_seq2.p1 gnl/TRDRNA2_/TRDRNA2_84673_c0~~gnl/TRDRNA2_/TRDRNA2_84673_c0_seq2.p1  ORF type:complete len:894 (-),score=196.82 gnl/TRDRNA2_/TRDRNA2_84673_c0_seq2:41-2722(-)